MRSPFPPRPGALGLLAVAACLLALSSAPRVARATWAPAGNQLTTGFQSTLQRFGAASDDAGGVFVMWGALDSIGGGVILGIHVLSDGTLAAGWPANGRRICAAPFAAGVQAAPDGAGGVYLAYVQPFPTGAHDLYAQRVRSDGNLAPGWPDAGLLISDSPGPKIPVVSPDGAGGAGVFWQEVTAGPPAGPLHANCFATRVSPDGTIAPGWAVGGFPVKVFPDSLKVAALHPQFMIPDGTSGFFLAWSDSSNELSYDLYVQRLTGDGDVAYGWPPGGRTACAVLSDKGTASNLGDSPAMIGDGADGVIVAWNELRGGRLGAYVMRIDGQGEDGLGWPPDAIAPFEDGFADFFFGVREDGAGGAWLARQVYQTDYTDRITVGHVSPYGGPDLSWPVGGVTVSDAVGPHGGLWLGSGGAAGAQVLWNASTTVFASRVTGSGAVAPGWPAEGQAIIPSASGHASTHVVPDRHDGEIVLWLDVHAFPYEIWGRRVGSDGNVTTDAPPPPTGRSGLGASPNPFSAQVGIAFSLPRPGPCSVTVRDIAGREVRSLARGDLGAGPQRLSWDGRSDAGVPQPAGIYVVTARGPGFEASRRIVRVR